MSDEAPSPDGLLKREHFTAERVRQYAEALAKQGGHALMSEAARAASRAEFLAEHPQGADLWVFGYGSLMWNPAMTVAESRRARVAGFRRHFCLSLALGRATPDRPGLMLGLDAGAGHECIGMAHRIAAADVGSETEVLWYREMLSGAYRPTRVAAEIDGLGAATVLAFVIDRSHPRYEGEVDPETAARRIAAGEGVIGSNRDYLYRTARQLAELGIGDDDIFRLETRVRDLAGEPFDNHKGDTA